MFSRTSSKPFITYLSEVCILITAFFSRTFFRTNYFKKYISAIILGMKKRSFWFIYRTTFHNFKSTLRNFNFSIHIFNSAMQKLKDSIQGFNTTYWDSL